MNRPRTDTVFPPATESSGVDIVERALAILEEETLAWTIRQRELAEQCEGGPNA